MLYPGNKYDRVYLQINIYVHQMFLFMKDTCSIAQKSVNFPSHTLPSPSLIDIFPNINFFLSLDVAKPQFHPCPNILEHPINRSFNLLSKVILFSSMHQSYCEYVKMWAIIMLIHLFPTWILQQRKILAYLVNSSLEWKIISSSHNYTYCLLSAE